MLRYLEAFFRNRWLVTLPALLLLLSGSAFVFVTTPKYQATTSIWTERASYLDFPRTDNQYQTPAENDAERMNDLLRTNTFSAAIAEQALGATATEQDRATLAWLIKDGQMFATASGPNVLRIEFWYPDSAVALSGLHAAVEYYTEVVGQARVLEASAALEFYQQRVDEYETTIIPRANRALTDYLANNPEVQLSIREGGVIDGTFTGIQQDLEAVREQYQRYRDRLDEISTQSQAATTSLEASFRVIDPAMIEPGTGTLRNVTVLAFAGVGAALALGYVALFLGLAAELDRTLRNAGDVRRRLQLPVLDVIPAYSAANARATRKRFGRRQQLVVAPQQAAKS